MEVLEKSSVVRNESSIGDATIGEMVDSDSSLNTNPKTRRQDRRSRSEVKKGFNFVW